MSYTAINPATVEIVRDFPTATDQEVKQALEAGSAFYENQKSVSVEKRAKLLLKLADVMDENVEELAREAAENMGKLLREGRGEVGLCTGILRYYGTKGIELMQPKTYEYGNGKKAKLYHQSLGIVLSVEPWNFPYSQAIRVLAPCFLLGNAVILKHAGIVCGCADLLEKLTVKAGFPKGAFKNLFLTHEQTANIMEDSRVCGVALTGSEQAGRIIAGQAGKNLIKSTMELGGTDVFAVLDDADLEKAVKDAVQARLRNCGQVCTSAKRFIVEESIYDKFVDGLKTEFSKLELKNPLDETADLGPLSSRDAVLTLTNQVNEAISHGAKVELEGGAIPGGCYFKPMILSGIEKGNPAYDAEFFGPVAQIYEAKDDADVIRIANDSEHGLAGAVYSKDAERARKVALAIETGQIFINQPSSAHPELPFGGIKNSGFGREMSDIGLFEFANEKIVVD